MSVKTNQWLVLVLTFSYFIDIERSLYINYRNVTNICSLVFVNCKWTNGVHVLSPLFKNLTRNLLNEQHNYCPSYRNVTNKHYSVLAIAGKQMLFPMKFELKIQSRKARSKRGTLYLSCRSYCNVSRTHPLDSRPSSLTLADSGDSGSVPVF